MYNQGPVIVMELPQELTQAGASSFLESLQPLLETSRPCVVLDCSQVRHIDSAGVEMLLHCLGEAMKRDGDLKLAAVSPESAVILELMRVDRLFEVFETSEEAAHSFRNFGQAASAPTEPWYSTGYPGDSLKAAS